MHIVLRVTRHLSHCFLCQPGYRRAANTVTGDGCIACGIGKYSSTIEATTCDSCDTNYLTDSSSATSASDCFCPAGSIINVFNNKCWKLATSLYGTQRNSRTCTRCGVSFTTLEPGATSPSQCVSIASTLTSNSKKVFRVKLRFSIILEFVSGLNSNAPVHCSYATAIYRTLVTILKPLQGLLRLHITTLSPGSIVPTVEMQLTPESSNTVTKTGLLDLINGNQHLFNDSGLPIKPDLTEIIDLIQPDEDEKDFKEIAIIVGIAVPAFVLICVIVAICIKYYSGRRRKGSHDDPHSSVSQPPLNPWMVRTGRWAPWASMHPQMQAPAPHNGYHRVPPQYSGMPAPLMGSWEQFPMKKRPLSNNSNNWPWHA